MRRVSPKRADSWKTRFASIRRASEFDPPNRQLAAKVTELERTLRDQIEAARPRNSVQQMREQARQEGAPSLFNLNTVMAPIVFNQASLRDIFGAIAKSTGINIIFDSTFQDRVYTTSLNGVTLGEALNSIVTANQLFFKIQDPEDGSHHSRQRPEAGAGPKSNWFRTSTSHTSIRSSSRRCSTR